MKPLHINIPSKEAIIAVVKKAGKLALSFYSQSLEIHEKANEQGLVSQADTKTEDYLLKELNGLLPNACFIAEESGASAEKKRYCWVIDPIDGTTNFLHHIPFFAVSVALVDNDEPIIGVIYNPLLEELFYACKGQGATLNDISISVASTQELKKAVVSFDASHKARKNNVLMASFADIARAAYTSRHFGSAVMDLAYVACGRLDAVVGSDLSWWDVASGLVIVKEAGGVITEFDGTPVRQGYKTYVAANKSIHMQVLDILSQ